MNPKKDIPKISQIEETSVIYEFFRLRFGREDVTTFNFHKEFKKGSTPE